MREKFQQRTLSLKLFLQSVLLIILFTIPFFIIYRKPPCESYYIDLFIVLMTDIFIFISILCKNKNITLNRATLFFIALALYWAIQPLIIRLPYSEQNYLMAAIFIHLAIFSLFFNQTVEYQNKNKILTIIAYALVFGFLLQSIACIIQVLNLPHFEKWILYVEPHYVAGNIAQRNKLGHYLFWGLLSSCFLFANKKIGKITFIILILFQGIVLGLVPSRTISLYIIFLIPICLIGIIFNQNNKKFYIAIITASIWTFICQLTIYEILNFIFNIDISSGAKRLLANHTDKARLYEWLKAWIIFKDAPFFGHGWDSYASQSYLYDSIKEMDLRPRYPQIFNHSHNIILQLLAEMGSIGCLLVVIGFIYCILPAVKQFFKIENCFLACLIGISLIHSLLEYPLWSLNFLFCFAIFLILSANNSSIKIPITFLSKFIFIVYSLGIILALTVFYSSYNLIAALTYTDENTSKEDVITQSLMLKNLAQNNRYLKIYAEESATLLTLVNEKTNQTLFDINKRTSYHNPLPQLKLNYIKLLLANNNFEEAKIEIKQMNRYFPSLIPIISKNFYIDKNATKLFKYYLPICEEYIEKHPNESCTPRTDSKIINNN